MSRFEDTTNRNKFNKLEEFYKKSETYQRRMADKNTAEWKRVFDDYAKQVTTYCKKNAYVLDLGCGGGWSMDSIKNLRPDLNIFGFDISCESFKRGVFTSLQDCLFIVGNVMSLPFPDSSFDVVTSHAMMEHIPDAEASLGEMLRVLKIGGYLIIRGPNMLSPFRNLRLFIKSLKNGKFHPDGRPIAVIKAVLLYFKKKFSRNINFSYREPVIVNDAFPGSDWDAIYLMNPIDLVTFANKYGMKILSITSARGILGKLIMKLMPGFAGGIYFVGQKLKD